MVVVVEVEVEVVSQGVNASFYKCKAKTSIKGLGTNKYTQKHIAADKIEQFCLFIKEMFQYWLWIIHLFNIELFKVR